jgi:hypothetical protein
VTELLTVVLEGGELDVVQPVDAVAHKPLTAGASF